VMELSVSPADSAALHARTEGWAAALQLAGVSLRAGTEISDFVAGFGGSGGSYVLEYLGAEVLARQPRPVQTFLLRTAVLDKLSASLCDAVLADDAPEGGAQAMLEYIERTNLFLTPLDAERRWFRYHQLFAEFLRTELERAEPGIAPQLYRRASQWYDEHDLIEDAIRSISAIPDPDGAASLIERHAMLAVHSGEQQKVLGWFRALPEQLVEAHPRLCVVGAWALYFSNELNTVERYLQLAERHDLSRLPPDDAAFIA
jgi:LuxR family maltose regulon positive regulatory protein